MKRINNIFITFINIIFLILISYCLLKGSFTSFVIVKESRYYFSHYINIIALLFILALIILIYYLYKKDIKYKNYYFLIIQLVALALMILSSSLQFPVIDDDANFIMQYATNDYLLLKNDQNIVLDNYFHVYPFQIGMYLLEIILCFISNNHLLISITILNIIFVLLMNYYLYSTVKLISNKDINKWIVLIFILLNLTSYIYIKYPYGWIIGLSLSIISIYYFIYSLKKNNVYIFILSNLILLLAAFIKNNYAIIYIAYLLIIFFTQKNNINKLKFLIINICCLLLSLNIATIILNVFFHVKADGAPMIAWLTMGSQEGKLGPAGWHNNYETGLYTKYNGNEELIELQAINDLKDRIYYFISNPKYFISFYKNKLDSLLLCKDFQTHAYFYRSDSTTNLLYENSIIRNITYLINEIEYFIIHLYSFLISIKNIKKHNYIVTLCQLCFIGAITYHLLFEAKSIYIFPWFTILLLLSCIDIEINTDYINNKILNKYKLIIPISLLLIVSSIIYNNNQTIVVLSSSYSNDDYNQQTIKQGVYISQNISFDQETILTGITLKLDSEKPKDGTIYIDIYDNDNLLSSNSFKTYKMDYKEYQYFDLSDITLQAKNYQLVIYSNLEDYNLIVSTTYTGLDSYCINDYNSDNYLNISLYTKTKGKQNVHYIYSINTIYMDNN